MQNLIIDGRSLYIWKLNCTKIDQLRLKFLLLISAGSIFSHYLEIEYIWTQHDSLYTLKHSHGNLSVRQLQSYPVDLQGSHSKQPPPNDLFSQVPKLRRQVAKMIRIN